MTHVSPVLAAVLVATTVSGAAKQTASTSAASPIPGAPRVELGAGGAWHVEANAPGAFTLVDTSGSVRLSRTWALEGDFAFRPGNNGGGIYRIQAKWR